MPQPQQSPEPASSVESQSILIIRKLLLELGSASALQELDRNGHSAHLERGLGLGSLGDGLGSLGTDLTTLLDGLAGLL